MERAVYIHKNDNFYCDDKFVDQSVSIHDNKKIKQNRASKNLESLHSYLQLIIYMDCFVKK